jgi:Glycosyltransferase family 87
MVRRKEFVAGVFLLAMTLSHVVTVPGLVPFLRSGYQNFTMFYAAGEMVRTGQTAALYDLSVQYRVQKQIAPEVRIRRGPLPYNHPPFEALLFLPFTLVPYWPAYLLWTTVNLVLVVATLTLLRKQAPEIQGWPPVFAGLAAAAFPPMVSSLIQGHDCILLLFLYVVALAAFEREHDVVSGAVLAAGLFRLQLALPLLLILAVRRWRLLLGFVPVAAALAALSVAMIGWHGAFGYVQVVLSLEKSGAGGSIVAAGMPNLRGMIAGVPGINAALGTLLTAVSSIVVVAVAMWRMRSRQNSARFSFTLATLAALLVSYHALTYDLVLLFPAVLLLFAAPAPDRRMDKADLGLLILLFLIPRFDLLGPSLSSVVWFALLLAWLFWKRDLGRMVKTHPL